MKNKNINYNEYESVDILDEEEQEVWRNMQSGEYKSVMTEELKREYSITFAESTKRNEASNVRLTQMDKLLARAKAKEQGIPYQVLLSSIIHKFLHGKLKEV